MNNKPNSVLIKGPRITSNKDFETITKETGRLHSYGKLYELMVDPNKFPLSKFALARIDKKPVAIASLTINKKGNGILLNGTVSQYPNVEIMAYTAQDYREQGLARSLVKKLLVSHKISKKTPIYVYSAKMEKIVRELGYKNGSNLHPWVK